MTCSASRANRTEASSVSAITARLDASSALLNCTRRSAANLRESSTWVRAALGPPWQPKESVMTATSQPRRRSLRAARTNLARELTRETVAPPPRGEEMLSGLEKGHRVQEPSATRAAGSGRRNVAREHRQSPVSANGLTSADPPPACPCRSGSHPKDSGQDSRFAVAAVGRSRRADRRRRSPTRRGRVAPRGGGYAGGRGEC
jgi:hypothetical protein